MESVAATICARTCLWLGIWLISLTTKSPLLRCIEKILSMIIVEYFVETWHVPVCLVSLIWVFYEILVWFQRISALRDIGSVWWAWPLILFHRLFSLFPWGCQPVIFLKLNAYKSVHWYRRGHWVTAPSQHISSWLEDLQLWWGSCPGYTRSMSIFFVVCRCGRPWWQGVSQFFYGVLHPLWNVNLKRTLVH